MVRAMDLQDNFSKTQVVERIAQSLRQQPDTDQKAFAQEVQKRALQEKDTAEPMEEQAQIEMKSEKEEFRERREQKERERRRKKEEEKGRSKSGGHLIDITI